MEVGFWIASVLSLAANLLAVVLLVQHVRKADPGRLRGWSGRLGIAIIALAVVWVGLTAWGVMNAFSGVKGGVDPSQKAALLAAGISEATNCLAAMLVLLLLPAIVAIVVRVRTRRRRPG